MSQLTPEVTWAQRSSSSDPERNYLYVNIKTPDVAKSAADLKITATNVSFTGETNKGVKYHVSLDLYAEIDPENSKVNHTDREVELVLRKKELKEEYWPRLVKDTQKLHFLKTDFDKWVDEDEQDEAGDDDYANNFGGFEGLDQGGLGNIDFSKLGANLGGGAEGAEGEESDEELPELEGDSKAEGEAKSPKIQEVS
ncbi:Hsp90 cochaperone SBA1 [Aspergillus fischeri NRRL 181]|uniref:Hsp90 binding co-chaperone (Sba1), putative n=1 Tax=Neosartorya fischeri (strain ATCC 1020 / DSM 3700 / CBS 544.65 / FGSC A1164 / JCM 1740 / NRRL 181 / WB 181) TaxID=331117 RepID=A1DDD3_NEOFI|nr:Hsp90 binding co-chaperone (Sba1), putative [Aspergillus fischeri NRRL 181]EAW17390.1 Hsp90 binding co-chaperone (Sba1), putative [Aspergillus fischeri NRRL 181]KAG2014446.1 hypothetical protein GB937_006671 [Aspergillus fischeri]